MIILVAFVYAETVSAQVLSESAKRKVTVGVDIYTDIIFFKNNSLFMPDDFRFRTINQGANIFAMYNFQLGKSSLSSFSMGLAISNHNFYSANSMINDIKADTIVYSTIPQNFKRTKINVTYFDIPAELKFRTQGGFKIGIGVRVGYKLASKQKYVGDNSKTDGTKVNQKEQKIYQLEDWTFGPTLRIGYKWISVYGYYQVTRVFKKSRGPEMMPLSVGLTITPF